MPAVMRDMNKPTDKKHTKTSNLFSLCVLSGQHVELRPGKKVTCIRKKKKEKTLKVLHLINLVKHDSFCEVQI